MLIQPAIPKGLWASPAARKNAHVNGRYPQGAVGFTLDKHGVWFLGGDHPADLGQAGMETKLRTCAAQGGGASRCCQEGLGTVGGAAAGLISSISGCGPSGLGLFWGKIRGS